MQRKRTDPDHASDDLPPLTAKQNKFVEGILSGKTASDAYRSAYDCSNSQLATIWARASELRANSNVAAWLSSARKAGLGRAVVTLEGHVAELERLREIALDTGNVGAAVQAEQLRGKASGHYTDNIRIVDGDPANMLKEIASLSPALAAQLAKDNGIAWDAETQH